MKTYDYKERTLIEFDDGTRKNYSKGSKYGNLQEMVVEQALAYKLKIGNPFILSEDGSYVEMLYYNQLNNSVSNILLDYEDWMKARECYWGVNTNGYCYTANQLFLHLKQSRKIHLHNVVTNHLDSSEEVVDHINRNKLDNRKSNLRIVTHRINSRNKVSTLPNKYGLPAGITRRKTFYEVRIHLLNGEVERKTFPLSKFTEACAYNEKLRKENGYLEERATTIESANEVC